MRGAFVVQLGRETKPSEHHFEGCVEEVDSGKELKFHSVEELLKFFGERFQAAFARKSNIFQRNTPDDGNACR